MFCLAVAASCSVIGAMSAQAADVTARPAASSLPSYDKAPEAQPFNWNGFYLGLNGGYAGARSSWSDPAVGADSGTFNGSGGTIGGQLGYNWQLGKVVLGVESDLDWMNVAGSAAGGVCATDGGGLCQTKQSWLGTTRLRAGYAFDNWLPYLTGGLAYGNVQASQPNGTSGNVQAGWTAGAGLEYGFSRDWSAKLEFLHIDLGTATFMGAASGTSTLSVPVTDNLVRAGINYHW
jgi:outer membrane immunogenic protein